MAYSWCLGSATTKQRALYTLFSCSNPDRSLQNKNESTQIPAGSFDFDKFRVVPQKVSSSESALGDSVVQRFGYSRCASTCSALVEERDLFISSTVGLTPVHIELLRRTFSLFVQGAPFAHSHAQKCSGPFFVRLV